MVRVAVDVTPLAGTHHSGVGNYTRCLMQALRSDASVELVPYCITRGRVQDARRLPVPTSLAERWWQRAAWPPLEWLTGTVDVVHGTNHTVAASRAPATVMVHDVGFLVRPDLHPESSVRYGPLLRRALARGATPLCASSFTRDELLDACDVASGTAVVTHPGFVAHPRPDAPAHLDRPYILYLGAIEARKNLVMLLDAYALALARTKGDFPDLVLAGANGYEATQVHRRAAEADLGGRATLTGWVDDTTVARLVWGAHGFAYVSLYEGFGMPPLEACSAGIPVLGADRGALPEVLGDAALLVDADTDAIAEGLLRLVSDHELRAALSVAGPRRAERYTWSATADATVDVWRGLSRP